MSTIMVYFLAYEAGSSTAFLTPVRFSAYFPFRPPYRISRAANSGAKLTRADFLARIIGLFGDGVLAARRLAGQMRRGSYFAASELAAAPRGG